MALRANWDGFLQVNLISIPVRAYGASVTGHGKIGFHQIHKACNSRIRYEKVCPIHGPVTKEEIVSGYEYAKGKYVLVDPEELKKLRIANDKTISVETFIHPNALDPIYYTDRSYFLTPNEKVGEKPFAILQKVMADEQRYGIAQVIFAGREELVLLRPVGDLLVMTMLSYADQIKKPSAFEDQAPQVKLSQKELKLAESLVEASTADQFDFSQFRDTYTSNVKELIEAKVSGKEIATPPQEREPQVINLMDALRRSLAQVKKGNGTPSRRAAKPHHPSRRKTG